MQTKVVRRKRKINKKKALYLIGHCLYCCVAYIVLSLFATHIMLGALTGYGLEMELMQLFK